jgi:hypothetical protein
MIRVSSPHASGPDRLSDLYREFEVTNRTELMGILIEPPQASSITTMR